MKTIETIKDFITSQGFVINVIENSKKGTEIYIDVEKDGKMINPNDIASFVLDIETLSCLNCSTFDSIYEAWHRDKKLSEVLKNMKTCPICGGEVTKPMIKYCSVTCRNKRDYLTKKENDIDGLRERNRKSHLKEVYKENEKKRMKGHLEWVLSQGLKHSQLRLYGITFLKENPEVVETLKLMNTKIKQNKEEVDANKKKWAQRNKDKVNAARRKWREEHKEEINERSKMWRATHKEEIKEYRLKYKLKKNLAN